MVRIRRELTTDVTDRHGFKRYGIPVFKSYPCYQSNPWSTPLPALRIVTSNYFGEFLLRGQNPNSFNHRFHGLARILRTPNVVSIFYPFHPSYPWSTHLPGLRFVLFNHFRQSFRWRLRMPEPGGQKLIAKKKTRIRQGFQSTRGLIHSSGIPQQSAFLRSSLVFELTGLNPCRRNHASNCWTLFPLMSRIIADDRRLQI